jgi:cyanophycinase
MACNNLFTAFLLLTAFALSAHPSQAQSYYPHKGTLVIVGGGEMPDTLYSLFAARIGGRDQPMVYIPTATADDAWIKEGKHLLKFSDRGFTNLSTVHTREKAQADQSSNLEAVRKAKGVFIGGGDQSRLEKAYSGTRLLQELRALLDRGGVIMGTSAGATIMGSLLIGGDHRKTPHVPQTFDTGFSFMRRTAIDQHVLARNRQFDLVPVLENHPNTLGLAIDESTAAVVSSGSIQVVGKSFMLVFDPKDWERQRKEWGRVYQPFRMYAPGATWKMDR